MGTIYLRLSSSDRVPVFRPNAVLSPGFTRSGGAFFYASGESKRTRFVVSRSVNVGRCGIGGVLSIPISGALVSTFGRGLCMGYTFSRSLVFQMDTHDSMGKRSERSRVRSIYCNLEFTWVRILEVSDGSGVTLQSGVVLRNQGALGRSYPNSFTGLL